MTETVEKFDPAVRAIAFYLPQYHPIPENNRWWGEGFTEWTNVRKCAPLFKDHYQPHVPAQLGYYDLRDPAAREAQAELARRHGIHGFCYYHYWFNGKRLLETPFDEVLASGKPDFPFCLCWANENWTRRWDGSEREILIEQRYSHKDDLAHIESLFAAFRDARYLRVNGKPLFLVYKTGLLPDPKRTAEIWREAAYKGGIGELYLVRVENAFHGVDPAPEEIGFDAAVEFAPHWGSFGPKMTEKMDLGQAVHEADAQVFDYDEIMLSMLGRKEPDYKLFRGAFPSWDNSPRRKSGQTLFVNSTPEKFAFWLSQIGRYTLERFQGDERLVFINAWNEWGEGCHLEPDQRHGTRHLEAGRLALHLAQEMHQATSLVRPVSSPLPFSAEKWYGALERSHAMKGGLSGEELDLLASVCTYALFTMRPLLDEGVQAQLASIVERKDRQIAEIYHSLSWRITAPLRKVYDLLFK